MNKNPKYMGDPIQVWPFDDAPEQLKALSQNGGDEDWIAVLPIGFTAYVSWIMHTSFDSCGEPQLIHLDDGRIVIIGSHA